jgi:carbon monoxide dehydrogenase subunit G
METVKSPVKMTIWVQIVPTGENSCKVRLTLDADVNPFIAKMVEKPLTQGVETLADMLTMISY